MPRVCGGRKLDRMGSTRGKSLAVWAAYKRDAPGAQDEMYACTQARIEECLDIGFAMVGLYSVRREEQDKQTKQRGRYVIVIVTVCGTKHRARTEGTGIAYARVLRQYIESRIGL